MNPNKRCNEFSLLHHLSVGNMGGQSVVISTIHAWVAIPNWHCWRGATGVGNLLFRLPSWVKRTPCLVSVTTSQQGGDDSCIERDPWERDLRGLPILSKEKLGLRLKGNDRLGNVWNLLSCQILIFHFNFMKLLLNSLSFRVRPFCSILTRNPDDILIKHSLPHHLVFRWVPTVTFKSPAGELGEQGFNV
jgi:hypothetical protein